MDIIVLLDALEDNISRAFTMPGGKAIVPKNDLIELIREAKAKLPDEIKQAKWVKEERHKILLDAQKQSESIIKEADIRAEELVQDHEIVKRAKQKGEEIINTARETAREVNIGSKEYADSILENVENTLLDNLKIVQKNREELK